jgi:hypothetical protein
MSQTVYSCIHMSILSTWKSAEQVGHVGAGGFSETRVVRSRPAAISSSIIPYPPVAVIKISPPYDPPRSSHRRYPGADADTKSFPTTCINYVYFCSNKPKKPKYFPHPARLHLSSSPVRDRRRTSLGAPTLRGARATPRHVKGARHPKPLPLPPRPFSSRIIIWAFF